VPQWNDKIFQTLFRRNEKKEEPKEGNVSTLKVSDNNLANSNSDILTFGPYAIRNCALPLDLTTGTGFCAENMKETECKLKLKCYNTLCSMKGLKIC
jgi:hypothetical protein